MNEICPCLTFILTFLTKVCCVTSFHSSVAFRNQMFSFSLQETIPLILYQNNAKTCTTVYTASKDRGHLCRIAKRNVLKAHIVKQFIPTKQCLEIHIIADYYLIEMQRYLNHLIVFTFITDHNTTCTFVTKKH